jgi:hypothetical protein
MRINDPANKIRHGYAEALGHFLEIGDLRRFDPSHRSHNNFNDIIVRGFILTGAPIAYKTTNIVRLGLLTGNYSGKGDLVPYDANPVVVRPQCRR